MKFSTDTANLSINSRSKIQEELNLILRNAKPDTDAQHNRPLRSEKLWLKDELLYAQKQNVAVRRVALKRLVEEDNRQTEAALKEMGMAFITTQP